MFPPLRQPIFPPKPAAAASWCCRGAWISRCPRKKLRHYEDNALYWDPTRRRKLGHTECFSKPWVRGVFRGGDMMCFFLGGKGWRFVFFSATKTPERWKLKVWNVLLVFLLSWFIDGKCGLFCFEVDFMWIFWLPSVWFSRECFVFPE